MRVKNVKKKLKAKMSAPLSDGHSATIPPSNISKKSRRSSSPRAKEVNQKPDIWYVMGVVITVLITFGILFLHEKHLAFLYLFTFIGLIYELKKLSITWSEIFHYFLEAFLIIAFMVVTSLVGMLFKGVLEYKLVKSMLPLALSFGILACVIIISMAFHPEKLIKPLGEGVTFLYSILFGYWLFSHHAFTPPINTFQWMIICIYTMFMLFTLYQVLFYHALGNGVRLTLSIYNSMILLVFSVNFIYQVLSNLNNFSPIIQYLQVFLLGTAVMYIAQNIFMLLTYLPDKHNFYGKYHRERIKEQNALQIARFSDEQVRRTDAVLIASLVLVIIFINQLFLRIPASTTICLILLIISAIIQWKIRSSQVKLTAQLG